MPPRVDAVEKVTGRAVYADDIALDRMLHAKALYAEHSHAAIDRVDVSAALAVPGVVDAIVASDVPGSNRVGGIVADHQVLADGRVLYRGDVVAVVAARTPRAAIDGVAAIRVAYSPLPPLLDPEEALRPDAPRVHCTGGCTGGLFGASRLTAPRTPADPRGKAARVLHHHRPDNLVARYHVRRGDAEAALASAELVVERAYRTQYVEHAYLEPESCVASPEPDGSVTVRGCMQHPFSTRRYVAAATGLPLARVRVVQTTLGGGFGGKDDTISVACARAAILALRTGRPVKLTYTREESMRESYKRHPFRILYRAGAGRDGKIKAVDVRIVADAGAYCTTSPFVIWRPTVQCTGPYEVPDVFCESRAAYTNGPLTGAMRGFGSPQINFAVESTIDDLAAAAGLDPVEFRRRNFLRQGSVTHTGQVLDGHTVSISRVLDVAVERFGWNEAWARCSRGRPGPDGLLRGVGLACSYRGVSLGAEGNDFCSAVVNVQPDGSVHLQVGVAENGQGLKTAMTRILAGEMGIPESAIRCLDVDTDQAPDGGPTVASRGTLAGGNAVIEAARKIKATIAETLLGNAAVGPLEFAGGRVRHAASGKEPRGCAARFRGGPGGGEAPGAEQPPGAIDMSWKEAVFACHWRRVHLAAVGTWRAPAVRWDEEHGRGDPYFTYVYGCNAAEVEVDPVRGTVRVTRLLGVHDVGRAIDPDGVRGQVLGGLAMGLGFTLWEAVETDETGRILNDNFDGYRIPKATWMPALDAVIVENPDPAGPWGAKSVGEPTNELVAPAVCNAIFHATGVRVTRLPVRPHDIAPCLGTPPPPAPRRTPDVTRGRAIRPGEPTRLRLQVNDAAHDVVVEPGETLLDVLRERLRLTGTKRGCDIGQCGACTVLVGGKARRACRVAAADVGDARVLTIEGLTGPGGALHPIQQAFIDAGAIQCGFCTPGLVLAAKALLDRNPAPSRDDIRRAIAGNLCRCTGYEQIVEAIEAAAAPR